VDLNYSQFALRSQNPTILSNVQLPKTETYLLLKENSLLTNTYRQYITYALS